MTSRCGLDIADRQEVVVGVVSLDSTICAVTDPGICLSFSSVATDYLWIISGLSLDYCRLVMDISTDSLSAHLSLMQVPRMNTEHP